MNILALDASGNAGSVAIVNQERIISEVFVDLNKTHSETLMPMVKSVFEMSEMTLDNIDYIAVSNGPGSFTGLRIGAATAKGLAQGANKKLISVPTLDAMAYNIFNDNSIIVPIMDARRNEVYTAFYYWEDNSLVRQSDYVAENIYNVIEKLANQIKKIIFLGDGVSVFKEIIKESKLNYSFAPTHLNIQKASAIGNYAIDLINQDKIMENDEFELIYLRLSQAEREYQQRKSL